MPSIFAISDTHNYHKKLVIPECDILIHAGDFTLSGTQKEVYNFLEWFSQCKATTKLLVTGNHDYYATKVNRKERDSWLSNFGIMCLVNDLVSIDGLFIYGTPEQTRNASWAYYNKFITWKDEVTPDIFITHMPPYGYCDQVSKRWPGETDFHAGDKGLTELLQTLQPAVSICGHIHNGYGSTMLNKTKVLNVAILDDDYYIANPPTPVLLPGGNIGL